MIYETLKVFDCQNMPDDVRDAFFSQFQQGNDSMVMTYPDDDSLQEAEDCEDKDAIKVILWLRENGAIEDEKVVVKYWG